MFPQWSAFGSMRERRWHAGCADAGHGSGFSRRFYCLSEPRVHRSAPDRDLSRRFLYGVCSFITRCLPGRAAAAAAAAFGLVARHRL